MRTEKFWDKYYDDDNDDGNRDMFDETCEFFSHKFPQEFLDECDPVDIILETVGQQVYAKNYDNILKFISIVQQAQPEIYKESFIYLNDFLVDYYLFHQDIAKVEEAFALYIANPLQGYDVYLKVFQKILFYQRTELLSSATSENYEIVSESDEIMDGGFEIAVAKFYMILQEVHERGSEKLERDDFRSKLKEFGFEFGDDLLSWLEDGLSKTQLSTDELSSLLRKDKANFIVVLRGYYFQYMYERGFEFYLSGQIWDKMFEFWEENNEKQKTFNSYFKVTTASFKKYLFDQKIMFSTDKPKIIATLWGSVYIYEFLHKLDIISTEMYEDYLKTSQKLKGSIIGLYTPDLWNSNFVHHWAKPDSVSDTEFREETNIFKKSISFIYEDFSVIKDKMADELSKIGEMSYHIIKGGESREKPEKSNLFNNLFNFDEIDYDGERRGAPSDRRTLEPVRSEEKIGRNDPCPCGSGKKYKKCCGKG